MNTTTTVKQRKAKPWNRCDSCGKFISMLAFEIGAAHREMDTPDSHYTCETYTTLCPGCYEPPEWRKHAQD